MTVKELIKYLEQCDPDYKVVSYDDEEIDCVIQHYELTDTSNNKVQFL